MSLGLSNYNNMNGGKESYQRAIYHNEVGGQDLQTAATSDDYLPGVVNSVTLLIASIKSHKAI